jgi:serine/threonine-protein kinase
MTGDWPLQNVPLLPPSGPWRAVVRAATQADPTRRPSTTDALQHIIDNAFYQAPEPPEVRAEALLMRLESPVGDDAAVDEMLLLVESNPDNYELCVDLLPRLTRAQLEEGIRRNPERGYSVVEVLDTNRVSRDWNYRNFRWADQIVYAVLGVAVAAADIEDLALLEKAAAQLFDWDASWNQWPPQPAIREWVISLSAAPAGVVADALRAEPGAAQHFEEIAREPRADTRIRDAIRRAA